METPTLNRDLGTAVWKRAIQLGGGLSPTTARALLKLRFAPQDQQRMQQLAAAARDGTLASQEENEIDTYEQLGCLLDILHSQARRAIKRAQGRFVSNKMIDPSWLKRPPSR